MPGQVVSYRPKFFRVFRGRFIGSASASSNHFNSLEGEDGMKIRPLQDRVIVKRLEEEVEKSKGGIIIPDTAKEKPQQGKIIAVGKGKPNDDGKVMPLDVKVGDTILFGKYSGSEIKLDGEEHLIMREEDILGVVER
jgi:chaperonin GroES